jgi:hypothetical protein
VGRSRQVRPVDALPEDARLCISFATWAELLKGAERSTKKPEAVRRLEALARQAKLQHIDETRGARQAERRIGIEARASAGPGASGWLWGKGWASMHVASIDARTPWRCLPNATPGGGGTPVRAAVREREESRRMPSSAFAVFRRPAARGT